MHWQFKSSIWHKPSFHQYPTIFWKIWNIEWIPVLLSTTKTSASRIRSSAWGNALGINSLKCLTLCGITGFKLREKYLKSDPFLWSWTLSPSYLISLNMPLGHFWKAMSIDLHGAASIGCTGCIRAAPTSSFPVGLPDLRKSKILSMTLSMFLKVYLSTLINS